MSTSEIVERLRKVSLYFWSGSSEPEYQRSDLPAEAAEKIDELERENAELREALIIYFTQPSSPRHDEAFNTLAIFATTARAALAGSGEK
jgi:hypothetical protein